MRKIRMWRASLLFVNALMLFMLARLSDAEPSAEVYPLTTAGGLVEQKVKAEAVEYGGRKAVRVIKASEGEGLAIVKGTSFQDGTIEADVAVKVNPLPPGARNPGFIGLAFRTRADGSHFELFYLRPGNSKAADQLMRNHSVQYCEVPDFSWYKLRREWPAVYESYADLQPEVWTKVKIEAFGRSAKFYVNGSDKPSLVVDGLKGEDLGGAVALWSSPGQDSYFSNLRVTPAVPHPIKNGGEAAGRWEVKATTDTAPVDVSMKVSREGSELSGTWSGQSGSDQPLRGTWRDGYVELALTSGNATLRFAGWIDGNTASGRMKVEGRSDGHWTAKRLE